MPIVRREYVPESRPTSRVPAIHRLLRPETFTPLTDNKSLDTALVHWVQVVISFREQTVKVLFGTMQLYVAFLNQVGQEDVESVFGQIQRPVLPRAALVDLSEKGDQMGLILACDHRSPVAAQADAASAGTIQAK